MGEQPALLAPRRPPELDRLGVEIVLGDCRSPEWLARAEGADLAIVDPPWTYARTEAATSPDDHYACLPTDEIAEVVARLALGVRVVVVWCTWPLLEEWILAFRSASTVEYRSGGAWSKTDGRGGHYGPGYWWAGCSEPVLVYAQPGGHVDRSVTLRNAWEEPPWAHSRKPVEWQAAMVARWCPRGGRVVDPFCGLGSVPEAVLLAGDRTYLGCEVDPARRDGALARLARWDRLQGGPRE